MSVYSCGASRVTWVDTALAKMSRANIETPWRDTRNYTGISLRNETDPSFGLFFIIHWDSGDDIPLLELVLWMLQLEFSKALRLHT